MPRFGLDSFTYLLSCILSTVCLAACSNSLVQRNHAVGEQSRAALAGGITLILKTTDLSAAGYALSVGSGGVAVGSLILFLYSLQLSPVPSFSRKIFFISPLMLLINNILIFAAGVAVTYIGRHGVTSAVAYLGTARVPAARIPDAVLQAQIAQSGLPLTYWSNGYVKFMVVSAWPQMIPNIASMFFAYKAFQKERPSAQRHQETVPETASYSNAHADVHNEDEKGDIQHIA